MTTLRRAGRPWMRARPADATRVAPRRRSIHAEVASPKRSLGDDVQDPACAPATVRTGRRRVVSWPSTPAGQGAARRAHEAHPGPLQLLRRERQLPQLADARRGNEAGLVQVAPPLEPTGAPHLGEVRRAVEALSSSASPHHGPNLGDVATSHLNGRAGWWKSPCPVPARAPGERSPGATLQWGAEVRRDLAGPAGCRDPINATRTSRHHPKVLTGPAELVQTPCTSPPRQCRPSFVFMTKPLARSTSAGRCAACRTTRSSSPAPAPDRGSASSCSA